jgi:hypothetical protein
MDTSDPLWNNVALHAPLYKIDPYPVGTASDNRIIGKTLDYKGGIGEVRHTQYFQVINGVSTLVQSGGPYIRVGSSPFASGAALESEMYFTGHGTYPGGDGNWGDCVRFTGTTAKQNLALGSGDFTIEFWTDTGGPFAETGPDGATYRTVIESSDSTFSVGSWAYMYRSYMVGVFQHSIIEFWLADFSRSTLFMQAPADRGLGRWVHHAIVKSGSTYLLFLQGDMVASAVFAGPWTSAAYQPDLRIGSSIFAGRGFLGSIRDIRITRGVARYTENTHAISLPGSTLGYLLDQPGTPTSPVPLAPFPTLIDPSLAAPFPNTSADSMAPAFPSTIAVTPPPPARKLIGRLPNVSERYSAENERQNRRAIEEALRK